MKFNEKILGWGVIVLILGIGALSYKFSWVIYILYPLFIITILFVLVTEFELLSLARRSIVSSWRATRALVSLLAAAITRGTLAPAGTFISARTERTSEMRRINQRISASASASARPRCSGRGREHQKRRPPLFGARFAHSSSVTKGMKGWSRISARSSTKAAIARVSAASASPPARIGLESSRYQSQ